MVLPAYADKPVYRVVVEQLDYAPIYYDDSGDYQGFARAVLDRFAEDQSILFEYVQLPVKRLKMQYYRGDFDFRFPDNPGWRMKQGEGITVRYSNPVISVHDGAVVTSDNLNLALEKLTLLATVRGFSAWTYREWIDSGQIQVVEANSMLGALRFVEKGRAQAAYVTAEAAQHLWKEQEDSTPLFFNPDLPYSEVGFMLSSIYHPERIEAFNEFLAREAEQIKLLKQQYGLDDSALK